jgi:hypothetical protein
MTSKHATALALAGALVLSGQAVAANLDKGLVDGAPEILAALKKAGVKAVGVLPFQVKLGERPASFTTSPLSTTLPTRLENALILRHGGGKEPMKIVRDAAGSDVWARKSSAFRKLFTEEREVAWGDEKVKADGFLTGLITNSGDRKKTTIEVRLLTADSIKGAKLVPTKLHTIEVNTDRSLLRDLGYNVTVLASRALKKDTSKDDLDGDAIEMVQKEDEGKAKPPGPKEEGSHSPDSIAGMRLEIEYDGVKQVVKSVPAGLDGAQLVQYQVAAPKPGQKVAIYLTRVSEGEEKLGVVLKVNGRSTYAEEVDEAVACKKWIYAADKVGKREAYTGFYFRKAEDSDELIEKPFKVLSAEEALESMAQMGPRGGWIDLDVFTTRQEKDPPADELTFSTRSLGKGKKPKTLTELRQLLAKANRLDVVPFRARSFKGVMVAEVSEAPAGPVKTDALPNPVRLGGISIRYVEPATTGE